MQDCEHWFYNSTPHPDICARYHFVYNKQARHTNYLSYWIIRRNQQRRPLHGVDHCTLPSL